MIRVKISHRWLDHSFVRQTPNARGEWGGYKFFVNEPIDICDFWIVYESISQPERCTCAAGATILFTGEPPCIKRYSPGYVNQFAAVVTCRQDIAHPNCILRQQSLNWHAGIRMITRTGGPTVRIYDDFKQLDLPPKSGLISMFCSDKDATPGHRARRELARCLKAHFSERLELFGKGPRFVEDKWEAIAPFKYHVAVENCQIDHYWTEKLADTYLCGAYPFYCGCPNIGEYFPAGSLTTIDVNDPQSAIAAIERAIADDVFERSRGDLLRARDLLLDRYNLFPSIIDVIENHLPPVRSTTQEDLTIRPESEYLAIEYEQANARVAARLREIIPAGARAVLVDEACSTIRQQLSDRNVLPFPEREGQYCGVPADDAAALLELKRMHRQGAEFIAFLPDTRWWLEQYPSLAAYVRNTGAAIVDDDQMILFDLRAARNGRIR